MNDSLWNRDDERFIARSVIAWTIGGVALILLVSVALWAFGVFTSDVKGRGDVREENNSAVNRVQQQAYFEDTKASYDGALAKIPAARQAVKSATTHKEERQVELDGLIQNCIDTAQAYNAQSRKQLAADWKAADLPRTLNATQCSQE